MKQPIKPVKSILNKTPSTGKTDWEKEFELWCDVTEVDRVSRESIKGFITQLLSTQRKEILFEVGNEFWHWYNNGTDLIEDVIKEITGVGGEHVS